MWVAQLAEPITVTVTVVVHLAHGLHQRRCVYVSRAWAAAYHRHSAMAGTSRACAGAVPASVSARVLHLGLLSSRLQPSSGVSRGSSVVQLLLCVAHHSHTSV